MGGLLDGLNVSITKALAGKIGTPGHPGREGMGDYLHAHRAKYLAKRAANDAQALADITAQILTAAIDTCAGKSDAGTRNARGIQTGATYGAALGALGASAGPVVGAIAFVVGFAAGLTQGVWPVDREHFRGQFQIMIAGLPPGIRMRLWPYFKQFAAHARINDANPPLNLPWRTIDMVNVNSFGSNQIIVQWMTEDLMASKWMPVSYSGIVPFEQLPKFQQYAWGIVASSGTDAMQIGSIPLARNFGHTGDAVDFEPNRTLIHPEMRDWVEHWHSLITCGEIRQKLRANGMPDLTILPNDPASQVLLMDTRSLV